MSDKSQLLKLARDSISSTFGHKEAKVSKQIIKDFSEKQGVFVTLHLDGNLRGCVGFPYPILPLYQAVIEAARSAAFKDFRFSPLMEFELPKIKIEISVLTVPKKLATKNLPKCIKIGTDGLIVKRGYCSGLLLPQVATEYSWSPSEFLKQTCHKAGLSEDAWEDDKAEVYAFQAEIVVENQ